MKVVVLASGGTPTNILVNYLDDAGIPPVAVLIEPSQSRRALLRGRARRLGRRAVFGQALFMALVLPVLRRRGASRLSYLRKVHRLRADPLLPNRVTSIRTVNAPETRELLKKLAPDAVVLSGTRIVKPDTLLAAGAPVLNIHAGITPQFRGVHGGYWALWSAPESDDSFVTYPLVQLAEALPVLVDTLTTLDRVGTLPEPVPTEGPGQQWYHPTLGQYLAGIRRGVR